MGTTKEKYKRGKRLRCKEGKRRSTTTYYRLGGNIVKGAKEPGGKGGKSARKKK